MTERQQLRTRPDWTGQTDQGSLIKSALVVLASTSHGIVCPGYPQYESQGITLDNLPRCARLPWVETHQGRQSAERNRYLAAKGLFAGWAGNMPGIERANFLGVQIVQQGQTVFAIIGERASKGGPFLTVYQSTIAAMRQKGMEIMGDLSKHLQEQNSKALTLAAIKSYLGPELDAIKAKLADLEAGQEVMGEHAASIAATGQNVDKLAGTLAAIHEQAKTSTAVLLKVAENMDKAKPAPVQTTASKPAPPAQPAAKPAPKDNGAANLDGIGQQTGQAIQATFDPAKHFKPSLAVTSLDDYRAKADALATSKGITTDQAIRSIWRTVADQEKNGKGKPLYMVAPRFLGDLSAYLTGSASPAQQTVTSKPKGKGKPANAPKQGDMTTATDHPATVTVDSMVNKLNVDKARFLDLVNSVREIGGANLDQEDLATCARELASMGANVHDLKTRLAMKAALAWLKTL